MDYLEQLGWHSRHFRLSRGPRRAHNTDLWSHHHAVSDRLLCGHVGRARQCISDCWWAVSLDEHFGAEEMESWFGEYSIQHLSRRGLELTGFSFRAIAAVQRTYLLGLRSVLVLPSSSRSSRWAWQYFGTQTTHRTRGMFSCCTRLPICWYLCTTYIS